MTRGIDDIRLTGFALGELDGAEQVAVQAYVEESESARRYVQEVRATARLLGGELSRELAAVSTAPNGGGLTDAQHAAIEEEIERALRRQPAVHDMAIRLRRRNIAVMALSMAASVLIVFLALSILMPYLFHHTEVVKEPANHPHDKHETPYYLTDGHTPRDQRAPIPLPVPNLPVPSVADAHHPSIDEPAPPDDWSPLAVHQPHIGPDEGDLSPHDSPLVGVPHGDLPLPTPPLRLVQGGHGRAGRAADTQRAPEQGHPGSNFYSSVNTHSVGTQSTRPALGIGPAPDASGYEPFTDAGFTAATGASTAAFPVEVSAAGYTNLRRFMNYDRLPPPETIRIEEMLNAFTWAAPSPGPDQAIATVAELSPCPWNPDHRLARIVLKARELGSTRPPLNVIFLVDGSESMAADWKMPLLKKALKQSLGLIGPRDQVAIVGGGHYLAPTSGAHRLTMINAIDRLESGGLARGPMSIAMAYECAAGSLTPGDLTRVILVTDGDWEHGLADRAAAERLVEQHARSGVGLSILELGTPNLGDPFMRRLAARGGGTWACADGYAEIRKALAEQLGGGLIQVAREVSAQAIFNPDVVDSYRPVGGEAHPPVPGEDFASASRPVDLGAGRQITALFEIIPIDKHLAANAQDRTALTVRIRYLEPNGQAVRILEYPLAERVTPVSKASVDFRFAASVAEFGMLLRDSKYRGAATLATALELAQQARGGDESGERQEFIDLLRRAKALAARN